jgi:ADP-ribose pyrophosphatase YjhB (NUDIX family)
MCSLFTTWFGFSTSSQENPVEPTSNSETDLDVCLVKEKYQGGTLVQHKGKNKYMYNFPMAQVTVDMLYDNGTHLLFVIRGGNPYQGKMAFPGGFVNICDGEEPVEAAIREGKEETHMDTVEMKEVYTTGNLTRDPRGYTLTTLYYCPTESFEKAEADDDARELRLVNKSELIYYLSGDSDHFTATNPANNEEFTYQRESNPFAFDHQFLLEKALEKGFFEA